MFSVFLTKKAKMELDKLPVKDYNLCAAALSSLAQNPYPGIGGDKEKLKGYENKYRIHISRSYTAVYRILKDTKRVCVSFFGDIDEGHKEY